MVRRKESALLFGVCVAQTYILEDEGLIPEFVPIGDRAKAISLKEINVVNQARLEGRSKEEVKATVKQLMKDRKSLYMEATAND